MHLSESIRRKKIANPPFPSINRPKYWKAGASCISQRDREREREDFARKLLLPDQKYHPRRERVFLRLSFILLSFPPSFLPPVSRLGIIYHNGRDYAENLQLAAKKKAWKGLMRFWKKGGKLGEQREAKYRI